LSIGELTTPVQIIGDGQDIVTVYLESQFKINANIKATGVKFVLGATICATELAAGRFPTMFFRATDATYIDEIDFQQCGFDFDSTAVGKFITAYLWQIKVLRVTNNCKNKKGGFRLHYVDYYDVSGNHFDMQFKNPEWECVHVVFGYKGGTISKNLMENSLADFIDVYPSTGNVLIQGNHLRNGNAFYITAKVVLSDVGEPDGGSNLTGLIRGIKITDNVFSGNGAGNQVPYIDLGMYDRRTLGDRVANDYQYYGENITVSGNIFDESDVRNVPVGGKQSNFILIGGLKKAVIEKNHFNLSVNTTNSICIRYHNANYDGTLLDKTSLDHVIADNTAKGEGTFIFVYVSNPVDTLSIKGNKIDCGAEVTVFSAISTLTRVVIEDNLIRQVIPASPGSARTFILSTNAKNITFRNQKIDTLLAPSGPDQVVFENCEISNLISLSANVGLLVFDGTRFTTGQLLINSGVTVATLVLNNVLALPPTPNHLINNIGTVTKYYYSGGVYLKAGSSIWAGAGTRPTATVDSAKFG